MRKIAIAWLCVLALCALAYFVLRAKRFDSNIAPVVGQFGITNGVAPAVGARSEGCASPESIPKGRAFTTPSGRTFYVWGPSASSPKAYPIVLAFHGWGSNGRGFEKWFQMEKYVDDSAFVVYPDAASADWDYAGAHDFDFVAEILAIMKRTWCVDETRVLALGFSYGSRFVNHLGCRRPDLVRAIVPAGGRWDSVETECVAPMPVLVVHRTRDVTMAIAGGRDAAERWAKLDGCGDPSTVDHGCLAWKGCRAGAVSFCEDTHFDPEWPPGWNHTMREEYRLLAWRWFRSLR